MFKSLGNGFETTGNRIFKVINHKATLITWSNKQCIICKTFLNKHQKKYCKKHARKRLLNRVATFNKTERGKELKRRSYHNRKGVIK